MLTRKAQPQGLIRELVEALDRVTAELVSAHDIHIYADDDPHPNDCEYCAAINQARAVLAKAKGES